MLTQKGKVPQSSSHPEWKQKLIQLLGANLKHVVTVLLPPTSFHDIAKSDDQFHVAKASPEGFELVNVRRADGGIDVHGLRTCRTSS